MNTEKNIIRFKIHELKTWTKYYDAVDTGLKTFELRKDDRGFNVGDLLWLKEWSPDLNIYTGRSRFARVDLILRDVPDFGLMEGYCIMQITRVQLIINPDIDKPTTLTQEGK